IKSIHPDFKREAFSEGYNDEVDINVSKNGRYASFDEELKEGDIVALFPPTSGG
ncbi:molybdopterin synthase sulfur carrier subunit, partial [Thermococci archaeon]